MLRRYKNFTAIDTHPVHEKEIIQQNFTALLNAPEMQIPVSGKEPTL